MDFDTPETLVQEFLNSPPRGMGVGGVTVQMPYPQLVELVRRGYKAGIDEERNRRSLVNPFVKEASSERFANLEFLVKEITEP